VSETTFIGGLNVRAKWGRISASWPLARLALAESTLVLELRGPMRDRLSRCTHYGGIEYAQLARGAMTRGVKLGLTDQRTWYFWTRNSAAVLAALDARGVVVRDGSAERRFFDLSEK
jgi:hypothetical protein